MRDTRARHAKVRQTDLWERNQLPDLSLWRRGDLNKRRQLFRMGETGNDTRHCHSVWSSSLAQYRWSGTKFMKCLCVRRSSTETTARSLENHQTWILFAKTIQVFYQFPSPKRNTRTLSLFVAENLSAGAETKFFFLTFHWNTRTGLCPDTVFTTLARCLNGENAQ